MLLNFPGIDVNVNNFDDTTPLHYFCEKWQSPDLACFHLFIKQGANVNAINSNGETPIFKAIFNNSIRYILLEALIKNNADVNITTKTAREGVLHYAVRLGRADLVSLILQAVPRLDLKGEEGYTPEELARVYNQQKIANQLKQVGELFKWLEENDISEMKGIFLKNDITLSLLPDMNDQLLKQMGIESIGMRLKIIKACEKVDNVSYNHPELLKKEDSFRNHGLDLLEKNLRGLDSSGEGLIQDGKIEYIKLLGSGASGDVWLGLYNQVEKVAVKVLKEDTGEKDMEEFQKEFEVLRAVSNEHVVRFYGAATKPRLSMVMEYCSRGSLYHVLKDTKVEIDWRRAVAFCRDTCEGLRALHNNNPQILHRDLKSLNLLVSEDWKVKLCDFGLSRFATPDNLQTMQKMRGTFAYCDPEIYNGKSFTSASDMYSLGIIIWEIVNRVMKGVYEQPYSEFKSITFDFDIIHKAAKEDLRPTIPPGCPPIFAEMISLLTHKSQSSRLTLPTLKGKLDEIEEAMKTNPQFV
uniref:Uncharacterized protein n=1 Tax=Arcella intermedia TaxID=1963864 RepID=A0A6B2L1G0_9EUKA